jgi:hypothetical protein
MKEKIFSYGKFYNEEDMINFVNSRESVTPVSIIKEDGVYKLFYLW